MNTLDAATLRRFVELAGDRLTGDWVVLGGNVLPLLGVHDRRTMDIDVAGPDEADMKQSLLLMEIAEELDLPVETINQAATHFLHLVDGWEDHLVPIHEGRGATIHVPDATLFLLLKLRRLSESDLHDARAMLQHAKDTGETVDLVRVREAAIATRGGEAATGRRERLGELLALLDAD